MRYSICALCFILGSIAANVITANVTTAQTSPDCVDRALPSLEWRTYLQQQIKDQIRTTTPSTGMIKNETCVKIPDKTKI
jgi:hypothetical protein